MPTYSYRCEEHGTFDAVQSMADRKESQCPTCDSTCRQVVISAPLLAQEAMAWSGMPGAVMKQQDRMTKQHRSVDQAHRKADR